MEIYDYDNLSLGKTHQIRVSNEFIDVYRNFNVSSQSDKMKNLIEKELYLLLLLCLDKHINDVDGSIIDPVVANNFSDYKDHIKEIFKIQDDQKSDINALNELIKESGNEHIDVDCITDMNGNKLPNPLTKDQVRDAKLDNIIENK